MICCRYVHSLRSIYTERKQKRKFSLKFVIYSLILFVCSLIYFTWCRQTLNLHLFFSDLFHLRLLYLSASENEIRCITADFFECYLDTTSFFWKKACPFPVKFCFFVPHLRRRRSLLSTIENGA